MLKILTTSERPERTASKLRNACFAVANLKSVNICIFAEFELIAEDMLDPIGIQNFEKLRKEGCVYVDKTALMYRMVKEGNYYFLSRPRRFGKSLLISTLEAYFPSGNQYRKLVQHACLSG